MWAATREVFNPDGPSLGVSSLSVVDIKLELELLVPGIHFDLGGRKELWHPMQSQFQGVRYYHRHICSADRDRTPMWPIWNTKEQLTPVPLDYALAHEDFPVLDIPKAKGPMMREDSTALVMRPAFDDVRFVGWAELLWQLLAKKIPSVSPQWWAATFNVPIDWVGQMKISPLSWTFQEAARKGWAGV